VNIPKDDVRLDHIQGRDEDGRIKEGSSEQVAARPLMGFQAVTDGEDDVTFQTSQVCHRPSELPAPLITLSPLKVLLVWYPVCDTEQCAVSHRTSPKDKKLSC